MRSTVRVNWPFGRGAALLLAALLVAACAGDAGSGQRALTFTRMVDLSHVVTENMPHTPGAPRTAFERRPGDSAIVAVRLAPPSGTSLALLNGPAGGATVDQMSPQELVLPASVLDVRDAAQDHAGYQLEVADLLAWEERYGRIAPDSVVLLVTGWDMRWWDEAAYLNLDERQRPQVPGFSPAAADLLIRERRVRGLGVDTPAAGNLGALTPAVGRPAPLLLHNLTSLEQLPPSGATLVIGALRLQAGTAAPARVLALVP